MPLPTLWVTRDDGAHWTPLATLNMTSYIVQTPSGNQPWHLCGFRYDSDPTNPSPNTLVCSTDGGQTWVARPGLRLPVACPQSSCRSATVVNSMSEAYIAADGSLLAMNPFGPVKDNVIQQIQGLALYRLPAGSTQWENLGPVKRGNANAFFYLPRPGNGVFWAYTGGTSIGDLSGIVRGPEHGYGSLFVTD